MSRMRVAGVEVVELFHWKGDQAMSTIAVVVDENGETWPWALADPAQQDRPRGMLLPTVRTP